MTVITIAMTDITECYWDAKKRFTNPVWDKIRTHHVKNISSIAHQKTISSIGIICGALKSFV